MIGGVLSAMSIIGIQKMTKQSINISCPPPEVKLSCPPPKVEGNGIEIEKLKAYKGKITINQNYQLNSDVDSVVISAMIKAMIEKPQEVRIRKWRNGLK